MAKVTIFSTPACTYCSKAKDLFKELGAEYSEVNVAADAEKRKEMMEMTGQTRVPVMIIGEEVLVGFTESEHRIRELLTPSRELSWA